MKKILITAVLAGFGLLSSQAFAANAACDAQATEKKLAGAAKTAFLKKCEKDAGAKAPAAAASASAVSAACAKSAADKKLAGAAKTSHLKKCMADEKLAAAPKK